jgi:hypothetical protein
MGPHADLLYAYAIVPAGLDDAGAPSGIDGARVTLVREGALGVLASAVDAAVYGPGVEQRVGEVDWLAPRAAAHDAVATWASDRGGAVPLPMFTLYRGEEGVRAMLRDRAASLGDLLAHVSRGREYVVRLFRLDDELAPALAGLSERVAVLERQAAEASPGQRYLLQRKLEGERREESRRVGRELAREAYDTLAALSLDAVADELPRAAEGTRGAAVLNAAFLVAPGAYPAFQAAVTALVRRHEGRGFRVEFTGPWPAHHFARERAGA